MNFTNATNWFPSDISLLKYDNISCGDIIPWTATWLVSDRGGFNYPSTAELVEKGIQAYWNNQRTTSTPPLAETFGWFLRQDDGLKGQLVIKMLEASISKCRIDFCHELQWRGVSDLAGRGMIATYFIQCIMVTAFFAIHTASRCGWKPRRRSKSGKLLTAVQESLRPFLDATLLFCIALNIAAIGTLSRPYYKENGPETVTMTMSSVYIALYGVFPAIVLHSCAAPRMRRRKERRLMWVFIAMLVLCACIMYFYSLKNAPHASFNPLPDELEKIPGWNGTYNDNSTDLNNNDMLKTLFSKDDEDQLKWESLCLKEEGVRVGHYTIIGLAGFLVVSAFLSLTFVTNIFRIPLLRSERSRFLRKIRQHWWMISAVVSMVIMWAIVIAFYRIRRIFNEYTGSTNEDKKWTFGQILAVATWAPVLMEVLIIWGQGAEKGLSGLMSDRFEVFEVVDLGEQRAIKSQVYLPPSDGVEGGFAEPEISVISPLASRHGSLSDSTAMETPAVDEVPAEPGRLHPGSNEKSQTV